MPARGQIDFATNPAKVIVYEADGSLAVSAWFKLKQISQQEWLIAEKMSKGPAAGSYLMGIVRPNRVELTYMPPPQGMSLYRLSCTY